MPSTHSWKRTLKGRASVLYSNAKSRCKNKNIALDLTHEWIIEHLKRGTCEITGIRFSLEPPPPGMSRRPDAPSLDRINKNKPYTKENTRVILWAVNCALAEYGTTLMLPILKAMVDGIENAKQKTVTPLPVGIDIQVTEDPESGVVFTTRLRENGDDFNHHSGAVHRLDIDSGPQTSGGNSVD